MTRPCLLTASPSCRRPRSLPALLASLSILAGCASGPRGGSVFGTDTDGPEANPPSGLLQVPDAEPRIEPLRVGGPNKPYAVLGRSYVPVAYDAKMSERGLASWYGRKFHGRPTASGEIYNMYAMTAAHPRMPLPSYARVRNPANGREIIVRVNDRGPFHGDRIIDLSYTAALKLGLLRGVAPVEVERLTHDEIRSGSWRREGASAAPPSSDLAPLESSPAAVPGAVGFWIQLGAFRQREGAIALQRRATQQLSGLAPLLAIFEHGSWHRLQAGPFDNRDDAERLAQQVRDGLQLTPVLVERR